MVKFVPIFCSDYILYVVSCGNYDARCKMPNRMPIMIPFSKSVANMPATVAEKEQTVTQFVSV